MPPLISSSNISTFFPLVSLTTPIDSSNVPVSVPLISLYVADRLLQRLAQSTTPIDSSNVLVDCFLPFNPQRRSTPPTSLLLIDSSNVLAFFPLVFLDNTDRLLLSLSQTALVKPSFSDSKFHHIMDRPSSRRERKRAAHNSHRTDHPLPLNNLRSGTHHRPPSNNLWSGTPLSARFTPSNHTARRSPPTGEQPTQGSSAPNPHQITFPIWPLSTIASQPGGSIRSKFYPHIHLMHQPVSFTAHRNPPLVMLHP